MESCSGRPGICSGSPHRSKAECDGVPFYLQGYRRRESIAAPGAKRQTVDMFNAASSHLSLEELKGLLN